MIHPFLFGKLIMKQLMLLLVFFSTVSYAAEAGFYVGTQLGASDTHYQPTDIDTVTSAQVNHTGFAGRIYAGYQWNANWAAELGYTHYANTHFSELNETGQSGRIVEQATDLIGMVILPFKPCAVYAQAGVAHINADQQGNLPGADKTVFSPKYGVGIRYDVIQNVPIEITWSRVQENGWIKSADLVSLGIAYHFG